MTKQEIPDQEERRKKQPEGPAFPYDNKVTVEVSESIGIIAMSILALILLIALLRTQARIWELQQSQV